MRLALCILAATASVACGRELPVLPGHDPGLKNVDGRLLHNGRPFTGKVRTEIPALKEVHLTGFREGREHGLTTATTTEGVVVAQRRYVMGVKHGLHRTWYRDGKPKSYARFHLGKYAGEVWEWHDNGRPFSYRAFDDKGQLLAFKQWRATGQVYMNFVYQNGAAIGLPGSKVCNPVEEVARK